MDRRDLKRAFATAARPGLFLDFDGTLSEIAERPFDARPLEGVREVLESLSERLALVAVASGRAAGQLLEWLGPGIEIWGLHGAERVVDGRVELSEIAATYLPLMRAVKVEAARRLADLDVPGALVEDKGVMVTLHSRPAQDRAKAHRVLASLAQQLADEYSLVRVDGREAYELRPPIPFSKERVIVDRARERQLDAVAFIGDDWIDLPAFDALDELSGTVATFRVAVASIEAPPPLLERADLVLDGPRAVLDLLRYLAD
jgi:trehalose 6-phosphate phosphatase